MILHTDDRQSWHAIKDKIVLIDAWGGASFHRSLGAGCCMEDVEYTMQLGIVSKMKNLECDGNGNNFQ